MWSYEDYGRMFSTFFKKVVRISKQDISSATVMGSGAPLPSFKETWGIYAFSYICELNVLFVICNIGSLFRLMNRKFDL